MSYTVHVANQSNVRFQTSDGKQIGPGETWDSAVIGDAFITSNHGGPISFLDLGDSHIGGDSKETWGVLISYQGEEVVGRYEGGGKLQVSIGKHLRATLSGMNLRKVQLSALEIG